MGTIKRVRSELGSLLQAPASVPPPPLMPSTPSAPAAPAARARDRLRSLWIRTRLRACAWSGAPLRIVVGSGGLAQRGWIGTDVGSLNLLRPADWESLFSENRLAAVLAEHVWEHLTAVEGAIAAQLCHRFLRARGYLRIAVPDGHHPDPAYREHVRVGGTGPGAGDHRMLYTHETLQALLERAGFRVNLLEYWDEAGRFHATPWSPAEGLVRRSLRFDPRNQSGQPRYTSLIVDGVKL